ncbi:MAG: TlpA family protein disulfide reductase [Candidatus Hodarchaeales archaeon]
MTQEKQLEETLASLNAIQRKQHNTSPSSPTSLSTTKIVGVSTLIIIIGFVILSSGNFGNIQQRPQIPQQEEGETREGNITEALDFKIQLLDSSEVMLSDYEGEPIILDLFATWCQPCITQIAYFKTVRRDFPHVQIVSVSVDLTDDISTLTQFKANHDMAWVVGRDITRRGGQIYSANAIPTLAFINSKGVMTHWEQGVTPYGTLVDWINQD